MRKKITVLGGGLIAKPLIKLLSKNHEVVTIVKDKKELKNFHSNVIETDLLNIDNCLRFVKGDYVYNLTGEKGGVFNEDRASLLFNNAVLGLNITKAAIKNKVRNYLYTSSLAVYNFEDLNKKYSDKEDIWLTTPSQKDIWGGYGKRINELFIEASKKNNFFIVRPSNVFGEYDYSSMVIPSLIKRAFYVKKQNKKTLEIFGNGDEIRTFTYSVDVARAIKFVMENKISISNIAGNIVSLKEIVKIICDIFNLQPIYLGAENIEQSKMLDRDTLLSYGFKYKYSLREGIEKTIDWFN